MRVGIVGLPASGKTTLFRALTRGTINTDDFSAHVGVVSLADPRVDYLANEFKPKKVTYASIEFVDGAGHIAHEDGRTRFGAGFFADLRQVDALLDVVRGFEGPAGEPLTPTQDLRTLQDELLLADLQVIENRVERVEKQLHGVKKGAVTPATIEMGLLERLRALLEAAQPLQAGEFSHEEAKSVSGYDFLTMKPLIAVMNVHESQIGKPTDERLEFAAHCEAQGILEIELSAQFEMEVAELSDDEEAEFLQSLGIAEPARHLVARECYQALGVITFITGGDPEVRAWTVKAGSKAIDAAGTIHSDLARGFIRAEVAGSADVQAAGGWEAAKRKGLTHLQGKDYIMQDGDVLYVRFKV